MIAAAMDAIAAGIGRALRHFTVRAMLALAALALLLAALGFGLALLYAGLQQTLGTLETLAVLGGGSLVAGLVLLFFAFRSSTPRRAVKAQTAPRSDADIARDAIAATERAIDEAADALREGSRERMVQALTTAIVTGIVLGRRL